MGFIFSLAITALGFVLALAVHPTSSGSVNVNTVGWILVVVGIVAFLVDLLLWSEWGPRYARRTPVAPAAPRARYPRRRIVEEEEVVDGPPRY